MFSFINKFLKLWYLKVAKLKKLKGYSLFFKGKLGGDDLEDIKTEAILGYLENGVSVEMPFRYFRSSEVQINVSEIPSGVDLIVVKLS